MELIVKLVSSSQWDSVWVTCLKTRVGEWASHPYGSNFPYDFSYSLFPANFVVQACLARDDEQTLIALEEKLMPHITAIISSLGFIFFLFVCVCVCVCVCLSADGLIESGKLGVIVRLIQASAATETFQQQIFDVSFVQFSNRVIGHRR